MLKKDNLINYMKGDKSMSLLQDYEMARRKIGTKKYDAINVYLEEICPTKIRNKYKQELKKINDLGINEWEREKKKLEQKIQNSIFR